MRDEPDTGRDQEQGSLLRWPGFTGRDRELVTVTRALADPAAVVLIEGEAGVGKSRLVHEYLNGAEGGRHRGLVAYCPPFREPQTLGPLVDAVRGLTERVAGLTLSPLAGALRPLFPEWAGILPPSAGPAGDATAARHQVFRALAELLEGLKITLLVVEDVHWADEVTVGLLLFLTAGPHPPVRLVMTYRPDEVGPGSLLRRLLARLPSGTARARVAVQPLNARQTERLASSMLAGEPVSAQFAALLHQRTEGVPLAVEELVRLLHDRGDLIRRSGRWLARWPDDLPLPPSVRDAVLERWSRLSADARAVMQAAAVLGAPSAEQVIAAVAAVAPDRARDGLREALRSGLLGEAGRGLLAFRHVLASQAVYETVPAPDRRVLHRRAATALEGLAPQPVSQLERHFREASELDKWREYAEQAYHQAVMAGDESSAAGLLHELIMSENLDPGALARLVAKLPPHAFEDEDALRAISQRLSHVLEQPGLASADRAQIAAWLSRLLLVIKDLTAAWPVLEDIAAHNLALSPAEAACTMATLGLPIATLWPAGRHRYWLDRAGQVRDPSISSRDHLHVAVDRATGLLMLGDEAGWDIADELLNHVGPPGEMREIIRAHNNLGDKAMYWGRYADARKYLTTAIELAAQYGRWYMGDGCLASLAHLDWFCGHWDGLDERVATLVDTIARLEALLLTGLVAATRGDNSMAAGQFRRALEEARSCGIVDSLHEPAAALARLHLAESRAEAAVAVTDEPMQIIAGKGVWGWATEIAPVRVCALLAAGDITQAGRVVTMFARGLDGRDIPAPQAGLMTCRALMAQARDRHDRAAALFGLAAGAWEALPRPHAAALARERQGLCLIAAGRHEEGVGQLTTALRGLSGLGAIVDAERVTRALRGLGAPATRPWLGGSRGYGNQLSPRELEVTRLVTAGHTNRETARILCRSPKTVAMQLSSAMRKLGVSSRAALAAKATEAGIVSADDASSGWVPS